MSFFVLYITPYSLDMYHSPQPTGVSTHCDHHSLCTVPRTTREHVLYIHLYIHTYITLHIPSRMVHKTTGNNVSFTCGVPHNPFAALHSHPLFTLVQIRGQRFLFLDQCLLCHFDLIQFPPGQLQITHQS